MIIYRSNKADFIEDTRNCSIVETLQVNNPCLKTEACQPLWLSSLD